MSTASTTRAPRGPPRKEPFVPEEDGKRGPIQEILSLKDKGHLVAYVGDVVGTGSSRKSATNSVLWWTGDDIPFIPNKRAGGVCLGGKIAPIFYNTMEDAGALPIELDVGQMNHGDVVELRPYEGKALKEAYKEVEDQEDEHYYHSKGWLRELSLEGLGLKAVLPPPEERKHVKTAIGAARAEQERKTMR